MKRGDAIPPVNTVRMSRPMPLDDGDRLIAVPHPARIPNVVGSFIKGLLEWVLLSVSDHAKVIKQDNGYQEGIAQL